MNLKLRLFAAFLFIGCFHLQAQDDNFNVFQCAEIFGDSITFLNDFDLFQGKRKLPEDPNGEVWDIYLIKDTEYRFAICSKDGINDKIMRLFDEEVTEENPYLSTGLKGKSKSYFDFTCTKSGIYKISIRFKNNSEIGKEIRVIGLLGFIRKVN
jgi:hypothetical protein